RRCDVGRDRDHESNRTNRRVARSRSLSDRLSGRAARARDDGLDAAPRGRMHRRWHRGWLSRRDFYAGSERHLLHGEHGSLDAESRHHHGSLESVLLRHSHCLHQLPQRIDRARRRGRRRPRHHRSRRQRFARCSHQQFFPDHVAEHHLPRRLSMSAPNRHNGSMIAVQGLVKTIGEQEILRGVDLDVARGETLAIIGRSGGGKSVLLKHLIGLMRPNVGEIWIEGQNIIEMSERNLAAIRQKVGILFQGSALFDSMTVAENIAFPLREAGERDPKVLRKRVSEMLDVMELQGQEEKMPVNLSGGMKKRVGLARSIIRQPSCILYDEPTSGLDPVVSDSINKLIRRLQQRLGVTSIVVTHDMKSAFDVADRIAYLHEGRIYFQGTPETLRQSSDRLLQDFLIGRSEEQLTPQEFGVESWAK